MIDPNTCLDAAYATAPESLDELRLVLVQALDTAQKWTATRLPAATWLGVKLMGLIDELDAEVLKRTAPSSPADANASPEPASNVGYL
jgi:hypothetical protein